MKIEIKHNVEDKESEMIEHIKNIVRGQEYIVGISDVKITSERIEKYDENEIEINLIKENDGECEYDTIYDVLINIQQWAREKFYIMLEADPVYDMNEEKHKDEWLHGVPPEMMENGVQD